MSSPEPVDLTNCDREPIHTPGSIQPHGCLLACDRTLDRVTRHSVNAADMLGLDGPVAGETLDSLIGADAVHALRNGLVTAKDPAHPALLFSMQLATGRAFDIAIHAVDDATLIEFEPSAATPSQPLQLARSMISRINDIETVQGLIETSAGLVRGVLGYDRVMIYRFEQDGAGKVVSEVKRADLESFLGQYFPATDIPAQARALYLKSTIRVISNADCERVALEPELDGEGAPLDLSYAHLRSVSPIHCEYLRNMGVAASMSISVIVDGQLWGLIACHHYSPRALPMAERVAAEMFGEFFSLTLQGLKRKAKLDTANQARAALDRFLRLASHRTDISALLGEYLDDFARLVPCDGVGLWLNGSWRSIGATPPESAAPELADFLIGTADGRVWASHALSEVFPAADAYHEAASGMLAAPISQIPRDYLIFFRKEMVHTLNWAGNPEKSYETGPHGDRLTPRKSFEIWKQTVRNQAQPWTEADREIAEAARAALVEVVLHHSELMADERNKADIRQRMLNEELNHRVKNILALIKSLIGQPVQPGRSVKDYAASLKGRVQALAHAHDQVVRSDGGGFLASLLKAELSPYRSSSITINLDGPHVWLESRAFSVMALVLHELSTNAAKYGSLSQAGGRLDVTWTLAGNGDCEIEWRESGGPEVSAPDSNGFGSVLINRSVPYDLGGRSVIDYARDGVRGQFVLPARHVAATDPGDAIEETADEDSPDGLGREALAELKVLLVEDQMIIAMDVESMLAENGFGSVTTATSASEALDRLAGFDPDIAVLDVNLGDETSAPVAVELTRRGIPFVFATGYGDRSMIPSDFSDITVVRKPYEGDALHAAILGALKVG